MVQKLWQSIKFLEIYVKGQSHKGIGFGVILKGFISWVYMPNMTSLSLKV